MDHKQKQLVIHKLCGKAAEEFKQVARSRGFEVIITRKDEELAREIVGGGEKLVVLSSNSKNLKRFIEFQHDDHDLSISAVEKRHILQVLAQAGGNKTLAAELLGVDTKTLYNKLKLYGHGSIRPRVKRAGTGRG